MRYCAQIKAEAEKLFKAQACPAVASSRYCMASSFFNTKRWHLFCNNTLADYTLAGSCLKPKEKSMQLIPVSMLFTSVLVPLKSPQHADTVLMLHNLHNYSACKFVWWCHLLQNARPWRATGPELLCTCAHRSAARRRPLRAPARCRMSWRAPSTAP